MSIQSKVGSLQFGSLITGQTLSITGLGFQPTTIMFWWTGSISDTTTRKTIYGGRSVTTGVGAGNNYYCIFRLTDNVATTDTSHTISATTGRIISYGGGGNADLQSFDADGFTLAITQTFPTNPEIQYMAIGGTEQVLLTSFLRTSSPGTGSVNLGFQPNAVFFLTGPTTYTGVPTQWGQEVLGWAVDEGFGAPKNGRTSWFARDNIISSNSTTSRGWNLSNTECYSHITVNGTTLSQYNKLTVTGFTATGFNTDWQSPFPSGGNTIWCLAIKGGHWKAGSYTGTVNLPTLFVPKGFITQGGQLTTIPVGVTIGSIMRSFGAASSDPSTSMKTLNYTDAVSNPSKCYTSSETNKIFENTLPSNGSNVSTATLVFNQDSVDITTAGNEQKLYVIFGEVNEVDMTASLLSGSASLSGSISHDYNLNASLQSQNAVVDVHLVLGTASMSGSLLSGNASLNIQIEHLDNVTLFGNLYSEPSSLNINLLSSWDWAVSIYSGPSSLLVNMKLFEQIGAQAFKVPLKLSSTHNGNGKGIDGF